MFVSLNCVYPAVFKEWRRNPEQPDGPGHDLHFCSNKAAAVA